MVGRLVRYTYTNQIGIVLRRKVTRKAIFRYDVFINGKGSLNLTSDVGGDR